MVELLLNLGAKTENKNFGNGLSPIQVALTHKNFLIAQYLIERNPSLIKTNAWNLIETAIKSSNPGLFQFLVDHGINIEQKSEEGLTPLFLATLLDKQEIVRGLARIGADLDPRTSDGMSPLMLAIQKNQLENIKFLLTATPEINRTSADLPPMPRNFFRSRKTSEALKKHYLNLVQEDKKHWTAIMVAIEAGELLDFSKFKSRQAKIHHITPHGITPLMIAAQSGNIDITKELLKAGGNPSNKNHFLPPAMLADLFGHTAIQNLLNHFEARPDTPDINNWKDLIPHRHPTPSNVDVNARNKWGLTPLALALKTDNRNIKIIKLLLNHGANPNASISEENSLGTSLLMIAAHKSSPETIAQLLNHGAKVNAIDKNGNTALTYAIINDKIDNLKLLIKRGAQVKQAHQSGLTPLQLSQKQHPYIIQLLEEAGASN